MSFPTYERYKDSGVEWLGEVPEHWAVEPLRGIGREREESNEGLIEENLLSLSYGRIIRKDIDTREGLLPESFDTYQIVHPGDIVFRLTDLQNDKRSLRTALVEEKGIITFAYVAFCPERIRPSFLAYLLRDYDLRKIFYSMGGGVRQSMNYEDIRRLPILAAPADEQNAICEFLDQETEKIDALIEEQQRLIALQKEKRQAVISHAVTKGLNPAAPMKDSGIDWLRDVPADWVISPIGHLCKTISYGFTNPMPTAEDGPYLLTANDIDYGRVRYETARRTTEEAFVRDLTAKSKPIAGDILITKDGTLGRIAIHDGAAACINQSVASVRVDETVINPQFLATCLQGDIYQARMIYDAGGTTIKHIYISRLAKMPVAFPSLCEQAEILAALSSRLREIDVLIGAAESSGVLLQERRSALISAAVTGKIDVRNYSPRETPSHEEVYEPA